MKKRKCGVRASDLRGWFEISIILQESNQENILFSCGVFNGQKLFYHSSRLWAQCSDFAQFSTENKCKLLEYYFYQWVTVSSRVNIVCHKLKFK